MTEQIINEEKVADSDTAEKETADESNVVGESEAAGVDSTQTPEFSELNEAAARNGSGEKAADVNRLNDVQVTVSAELGRAKVSIEELLRMSEGSVFELNRTIKAPVELIAQGVPLGNGEVVVVNGNFAIRIQQIYEAGKTG